MTEALLLARRGSRSGPPTPRSYDEEARINSILAPRGADARRRAAAGRGRRGGERPGERRRRAPPASAIRSGAARRHRDRGEPPATATVASGKDRVLDSSDLRGSVRNQVRGERRRRRRSGGAQLATPIGGDGHSAGGRRPPVSQPPADSGDTFGFGQRSTGALEWKLGPASDEPVPAR